MVKRLDYPLEIRPLSADEGGGFLISYPDFSDCISDGETVEEALAHGQDARKATIATLKVKGLPVPAPNGGGVASGKFVARVPKTVHAQLATRAKAEGVSLNSLVLTFIARGLQAREEAGGSGLYFEAAEVHQTLQERLDERRKEMQG